MKSIQQFFIFYKKIVNPTKIVTFAAEETVEND